MRSKVQLNNALLNYSFVFSSLSSLFHSYRSKRHKSGSMEDDIDTSPGGEYYTSPNSPASSSRNWPEEMEGGQFVFDCTVQCLCRNQGCVHSCASHYLVKTKTEKDGLLRIPIRTAIFKTKPKDTIAKKLAFVMSFIIAIYNVIL